MKYFYYFFFLVFILSSCRGDQDEDPPQISFISPTENSNAEVGESFRVKAQILDNEIVKSVRLSLINSATKVPVLSAKTFHPNTASYELNYEFKLDNPQLDNGTYYFEIFADDGDNEMAAFRTVNVSQVPRVLKGVILLTKSNSLGTNLSVLELNQSSPTAITNLNIELKKAVLNNLYQQLWLVPKGKNDVQLFDLNKELTTSTIPSPNSPKNDAFSYTQLDENLLYLSDYNGLMNAYSTNVSDRFTYGSPNQTYVETFDVFNDRIFIAEQGNGIGGTLLRMIWKFSGGVISSANINKDVTAICARTENVAFLFSNQSGSTKIEDYYFSNGSAVQLATITNDLIKEVIRISSNFYLLVGNSGVYYFDYRWKRVTTIKNAKINSVTLDKSRGEFLVAYNNKVDIYSAKTFQLINSYTIGNEEVLFAAFWFNR